MEDREAPTFLERAALGLVSASATLKAAVLGTAQWMLFARPAAQTLDANVRRILVYRIGAIGDMLVTIPTLAAIRQRFPTAEICLLTSTTSPKVAWAKDLFHGTALFDDLVAYYAEDLKTVRGRVALLRKLRARRFDLFVNMPMQLTTLRRELKYMTAARLIGCQYAVGFEVSFHQRFRRAQQKWWSRPAEARRIHAAVAPALDLPVDDRSPELHVDDESRARIEGLMRVHGLRRAERYVVIHPGAKRQTNRWSPARFAIVADEIQKTHGVRVVLAGGPGDKEAVESVASLMRAAPINLCGETTVMELAALLEKATMLVCNDSGPMHLAAAVGTPTVSIFSARAFPESWRLTGHQHRVLRKDVSCSPCFKEECDLGLICLEAISVDEVLRNVSETLGESAVLPRDPGLEAKGPDLSSMTGR